MNLYLFDIDRTLVMPAREKNFDEVIHTVLGIDVKDDKDRTRILQVYLKQVFFHSTV